MKLLRHASFHSCFAAEHKPSDHLQALEFCLASASSKAKKSALPVRGNPSTQAFNGIRGLGWDRAFIEV